MKKDEAQTKWDVMDEVEKNWAQQIEQARKLGPKSNVTTDSWKKKEGQKHKWKKKNLSAKQKIDRRKKKKIWEPRQIMANRSRDYGI